MYLTVVDEALILPQSDAKIRAGLCICFPGDANVFGRTRAWHGSMPSYSVLLEDADRVLAHLGVVRRTITVGDTPLVVAGVQNVFVVPECRGQGLAVRVLETAMTEARSRSFDGGLLFCVPALVPLYACAGWHDLGERQVIRVEDGRELPLPGKNTTMFYPLRVADMPDGVIHLGGNDW